MSITKEDTSLDQLFDMFPDEETARNWFERTRWGQPDENGNTVLKRVCPHCGGDKTYEVKSKKPQPYRCP